MGKLLLSLFLWIFLIGCDDSEPDLIETPTDPIPVYFPLEMSSPKDGFILLKNEKVYLQAKGGKPPYSFTKYNEDEPGRIDTYGSGSSQYFFADDITGNTIIELRDSPPSNQVFRFKIQTNDVLHFEQSQKNIIVGSSFDLHAMGGIPPYTYKYISGDGGVLNGSNFKANMTPGSSILGVFDSRNNEKHITINISTPLNVPDVAPIAVRSKVKINPTGGFPPYSFSVTNLNGSIDNLGNYQSENVGEGVILIKDSEGFSTTKVIQVIQAELNVPGTMVVIRGETEQIPVSGGSPPYSYEIRTSPQALGFVNNIGQYTAPLCEDGQQCLSTETVWVKDSAGTELGVDIIFNNQLSISPKAVTINAGEEIVLSATGGSPSFGWTFSPNVGTIISSSSNGTNITYRAPSAPGQGPLVVMATVTDAKNRTSVAPITVSVKPQISPKEYKMTMNNSMIFTVNSGVPPYEFSIQGSVGKIEKQSNGVTALLSFDEGQDVPSLTKITVVVTDSWNVQSTAEVSIYPRLGTDLEQSIEAGEETFIEGMNGVPPYRLSYTDGTIYSSKIFNDIEPNVMRYIAPSIPRDGYEYLRIYDDLNNFVDFRMHIISPLVVEIDNLMTKKDPSLLNFEFEPYSKITTASKIVKFEKNLALDTYQSPPISPSNNLFIENLEDVNSCDRFKSHEFNRVITPVSVSLEDIDFTQKLSMNLEFGGSAKETRTCEMKGPIKFSRMNSLTQADLNTSCSSGFSNLFNIKDFSFGRAALYCQTSPDVSIKDSCSKYNPQDHNHCERWATNVFSFSKNNKTQGIYFDLSGTDFDEKEEVTITFWARIDISQTRSKSNQNFKLREDASIISFDNGYKFSILTKTENSNPPQGTNRLCFGDDTFIENNLPCYGVYAKDSLMEWTHNGQIKGKWAHYGFVFNKDYTKNKFYINGVNQALIGFDNSYLSPKTISNKFKIGGNYGSNDLNFDGEVGSIKIYDKAIKPSNILSDYQEKKTYYGN